MISDVVDSDSIGKNGVYTTTNTSRYMFCALGDVMTANTNVKSTGTAYVSGIEIHILRQEDDQSMCKMKMPSIKDDILRAQLFVLTVWYLLLLSDSRNNRRNTQKEKEDRARERKVATTSLQFTHPKRQTNRNSRYTLKYQIKLKRTMFKKKKSGKKRDRREPNKKQREKKELSGVFYKLLSTRVS